MSLGEYKPIRYAHTMLKELEYRWRDVENVPEGFSRKTPVSSPDYLYKNYSFLFAGLVHERFVVFLLNSANKVQGIDIISEGILNTTIVHPREVFKFAIAGLSASIILAHNHPSGSAEPSAEDIQITKQLVEAGKILGIPVRDHVVFTESSYTSFAERGLI